MASGPPTVEIIKKTTETIASYIQWVATLIRRRNWFMLLVLVGVALALLGSFFKEKIDNLLPESARSTVWASFWTGVVLVFVAALIVAVVTMPRSTPATEADVAERRAIKGLRPFGRKDAEIFARLQREGSLRECCEALTRRGYKFGILMGESGCGKTSFLQAGLWPQLTQPESSHYAVYVRFSDREPMETVRKAIAEQLEIPLDWLSQPGSAQSGSGDGGGNLGGNTGENGERSSFSQLLTQAIDGSEKPIILLFDQFEQFFVHNPRPEDRKPFVEALKAWYGDGKFDNIKVLVSVRADLLHELYELHEALQYNLGPQDIFKLERFTPKEATKILAVIAETEDLKFDRHFVTELAERELAHRERGTISPVDLQVLAWTIERQKGDDLRAFDRTAFQKFGGVEGLLARFLSRTLDARVLPNQRQAAVKTLIALTDLDRQVRAGVLTVAELQAKLKETAKPQEIAEAVTWLARGDVRLITPQDKEGTVGYELAHERLIPALMRLAGKELTVADKANQLLDRRVNEWLGNRKNARYLLGWRELWLIHTQRPYLVWGAKREQKERLIRLSQRRTYGILGFVSVVALVSGTFLCWLNFTPSGQIQQVRWFISVGIQWNIKWYGDESTASIANALIKDGRYAKGVGLIRNHINSQGSKAYALEAVARTAVRLPEPKLVKMALEIATESIDNPFSQSRALSAIAGAYGQLEQDEEAVGVLEKALTLAESIDDPNFQSNALRAIAEATGQLEKAEVAVGVLEKALTLAESIDDPNFQSNALRA
ncbi:MAG: hypothetical protein SWY16_13695, partial [Cyanobacteriota bacterium]|nr:hypothetical protein [Cyanobacteriota bacterium]